MESNTPTTHITSGHQRLFLLSSSHPEWKNNVQTQTAGKFTEDFQEDEAVTSNE